MSDIVEVWPELAGFVVLAVAFWFMFKRSLTANSEVISEISQSNVLLKNSLDDVLNKYRALSEDQVKELDRCRGLLQKAVDENVALTQRYDSVRLELAKVGPVPV